jgi:predicted nucleic acid-binding protein
MGGKHEAGSGKVIARFAALRGCKMQPSMVQCSQITGGVTHGLTAYDAAYVALARKLSLPLVTADEALIRRLDSTGLEVRWLGE